jgi:aspartyl-tRNA(Asn)/glutamyl-tRNA(Gln) amidotransferase subunit A
VLKQLEADHPELNAFHLFDVEMGRRMAKNSEARWMKGEPIGALDSVPVPITDTNAAKGWPFCIGSKTTSPDPVDYDGPARWHGCARPGRCSSARR